MDEKVVSFDNIVPESALPRVEQDLVEGEEEEDAENSDSEGEDGPEMAFVEKHSQLLIWMIEGNIHAIRECLGECSFCLMETVKGKNLEGVDAVVSAYDRLIKAHQERIRLINPAELKAEKGEVITTIAVFGVLKSAENEEVYSSTVQETVWWNTKQNTVIISRSKR